ncbi:A-kinase anchor protein 13-like isoform X2 [Stegodyphus dumicola]|uniref:A-kinase anchor protein 13-like isoform X2 n=1 Tax=Stegodyphus dumicola TaxID=202533 RepID=UPI0015A96A5C|nr:A-kinase anchor protein 13-like isoform X2 [Stegodyphus dumicola]
MDLRIRTSSSDSEGENVDSSVKILINDVTPCDSREFLHLSGSVPHFEGAAVGRKRKQSTKGPPQRRASWTSSHKLDKVAKLHKCWSVGCLVPDSRQIHCDTSNDLSFHSGFNNPKEGSSDSIPEGMREKQRSFSAGSREDVFMFCNQLQDSVQSMSDMMAGASCHTLSTGMMEPKVAKKHSLAALTGKSSCKESWLIAPRSTLQKSVSTPSIVAAQEIQDIARRRDGRDSSFGRNRFTIHNVRNSCIEIMHEDEEPEEINIKRISSFSLANLLRENVLKSGGQVGEEDKPFSKRKKRGSLFFRKKKNKEKESKKNSSHQFVSICYSTAATCDVCSRGLANKSALKCENCSVTIHESSCKDHVPNCIQQKVQPPQDMNSSLLTPSGSIRYPSRYRHLLGVQPIICINSTSVPVGKCPQQSKEKRSSVAEPSRTNVTTATDSPKMSSSSSSKVICEEKEVEVVEDSGSNIYETNSASMESLEDGSQGCSDVEDDAMLHLLDDEPESWHGTVDKKVLKKLKEKDVKRQEAIYELILTEKHHCLTLKVMQRVFAKGMMQELNVSKDMVQRIFPCLDDLLRIHLTFLQKLRERQKEEVIVPHVGDVILQQFDGQNGDEMCTLYSQFCSQHKEALSLYKDILKSDRKFQSFVKRCGTKSFCKARGIPECILLVTQRVTKYPLLVDALIRTTKDNKLETERLSKALAKIKDIVLQVNSAVAEKEKEERLLEIYNRIDAKSTAFFKRKKFKKSDLLSDCRKLRFEGSLEWKSARGKVIDVHVIILSDVIVLLQENNQKYSFAALDNKAAVISLQKLLVREKAGQNSRGIYLISSNPSDPEMYEMLCSTPKDKKLWLQVIRESVAALASQEAKLLISTTQGPEPDLPTDDERSLKIAELCAIMQEKDMEIVALCEEKMKAMFEALELLGFEKHKIQQVDFQQLLQKNEEDTEQSLLATLNYACHLASRLFYFNTNPYLCSMEGLPSATMSPVLPRRAETFGGFDASREQSDKVNVLKKKLLHLKEIDGEVHGEKELSSSDSSLHIKSKRELSSSIKFISRQSSPDKVDVSVSRNSSSQSGFNPLEEMADLNQLLAAVMSLFHHHLSICRKECSKRRYRPDHQLEELRNIQEKLSQERLQWESEKAQQEKELEKKKKELLHMQKLLCENHFKQPVTNAGKNTLSCFVDNREGVQNCCSTNLCRHRRSASFDFRTLGSFLHDVGGRQSWSGPIDDASFTSRSHSCSTQSTSSIPQAMDNAELVYNNQNNIFVENSGDLHARSDSRRDCQHTSRMCACPSVTVITCNENSSDIKIGIPFQSDMRETNSKCFCSMQLQSSCTTCKDHGANGK